MIFRNIDKIGSSNICTTTITGVRAFHHQSVLTKKTRELFNMTALFAQYGA